MSIIVTPITSVTWQQVHLIWNHPTWAAMTDVRWLAERIAELLDDFGVEEDIWADVEITRANVVTVSNAWLVWVDGRPVVACLLRSTAHRIAHLLDRYGLADVPDTPEELAA